jgi:zinc and cadmium transporter
MPTFWWIILFSLAGSLGAALGGGLLLLTGERLRRLFLPHLVSYAVGTLLGAAFLALLPRALEDAPGMTVLATALLGLVGFFVLEKWVLWRHCHETTCEIHAAAGDLILIGNAFHNFVDGFAIAAAFLVAFPIGVSTSLAVIAHEIPQELGDLAILVESGYGRTRAFAYNLLSSSATLPGALLAYAALSAVGRATPFILAISAASFIYIATADLIPGLHQRAGRRIGFYQLVLVLAGIATISLFVLHR